MRQYYHTVPVSDPEASKNNANGGDSESRKSGCSKINKNRYFIAGGVLLAVVFMSFIIYLLYRVQSKNIVAAVTESTEYDSLTSGYNSTFTSSNIENLGGIEKIIDGVTSNVTTNVTEFDAITYDNSNTKTSITQIPSTTLLTTSRATTTKVITTAMSGVRTNDLTTSELDYGDYAVIDPHKDPESPNEYPCFVPCESVKKNDPSAINCVSSTVDYYINKFSPNTGSFIRSIYSNGHEFFEERYYDITNSQVVAHEISMGWIQRMCNVFDPSGYLMFGVYDKKDNILNSQSQKSFEFERLSPYNPEKSF